MKKLYAFYFSGTGNTKFVAERLCAKLSGTYKTAAYDIAAADCAAALAEADIIMLAYPIYGSCPPVPMRRFVYANKQRFNNREVIIAVTQYMFSGDGAASLGRTVEKFGGKVVYAEHFNMPNNICDMKILKIRNGEELRETVSKAEKRMDAFVEKIVSGKPFRRGFNVASHAVGYYCQRKFFRKGEPEKKSKLKIDAGKCLGCCKCVKQCPVHNIVIDDGKAVPRGDCALCYRCVNNCPVKAITLFGSAPPQTQYKGIEIKGSG